MSPVPFSSKKLIVIPTPHWQLPAPGDQKVSQKTEKALSADKRPDVGKKFHSTAITLELFRAWLSSLEPGLSHCDACGTHLAPEISLCSLLIHDGNEEQI